ncbi:MAG: hypothetical protein ABH952_05605 [Candidatus Omnitrophota bacterium]
MKTIGFQTFLFLIELMIVIAIVALLAGAMVPLFRTTRYDAQKRNCRELVPRI